MTSPRIEASVSTPMPPISTPMKMKTCPNGDQYVAMSTVDRPVTQITETAVNSASTNGACSPEVVAIGSENSTVKTSDEAGEDQDGEARGRRGDERVDAVADPFEHGGAGHRLAAHPQPSCATRRAEP